MAQQHTHYFTHCFGLTLVTTSLCYASVFQRENLVDVYICIRRVKPVLFLIKTIAGLQHQHQGSVMGTDVQRELRANHGHSRALWTVQRPSEG